MTPTGSERPRKPWYRARNIILFLVLAVVLWIGVEVYSAVTATPGMAVNYAEKVNELVRQHQPQTAEPGDPNGWDLLVKACSESSAVYEEYRSQWSSLGPGTLDVTVLYSPVKFDVPGYDPESQKRLKQAGVEAIERLRDRGVFEHMAAAARTPYAFRAGPTTGPLVQIMLPHLSQIRQLARVCTARMCLATRAGDADEFVGAYEQMLAAGRICTQQSFLIEHLVGYAVVALANAELSRCCTDRHWDEATLRRCMEALDRQSAWMGRLDIALEAERYSVLDTIQWTHTDDGRGSGRLIVTSLPKFTGTGFAAPGGGGSWLGKLMQYRIGNLAGLAYPSKKAVMRKANQYFDKFLLYNRATPEERQRMQFHPDRAVEDLSPRHLVLRLVLPALGKSIMSSLQNDLSVSSARVIVVIEIYRARHGEYPESLDQVVPEILPAIPPDPFGTPFGYRRLSAVHDNDPRPYLVYSLGDDRTDNRGRQDPKNPHAAVQGRGPGFDLVVNHAREKQPEEEPKPFDPSSGAPAEAPPGDPEGK
jgi:hypothetical protein